MYTIKFFRFIFPVLLLFGQAFADTLVLPEPKGIYGVGTINLELSDPSRTQLRNNKKRHWMATFYKIIKN